MTDYDLLFFCSLCREKSPEEISRLKCRIPYTKKQYKKGEYIAYHGDKVSNLKMLVKGRVKTEIVSDSGLCLPVEEITAPFPLAAAFLFADDNCFPVDVLALEDSEVLYIHKEEVEKKMTQCLGFLRGFMAFNANRMKSLSERLKIFAQKGIKAKIAYYILSKETKGHFVLDRKLNALAEYFGVERPSLSRALSEMVKEGSITYANGEGEILNTQALMGYFL